MDRQEFQEHLVQDNCRETPTHVPAQPPLWMPYLINFSRKIGDREFHQSYTIVKLGHYPSTIKLTKKAPTSGIQYKIPDEYKVKTTLLGWEVTCQTKYLASGSVQFTMLMKDDTGRTHTVHSDKSASAVAASFISTVLKKETTRVSGTNLFGFDITCLHDERERIAHEKASQKLSKRPYEAISKSQQNKRLVAVAHDIQAQIGSVLEKHQLSSHSSQSDVVLKSVDLEISTNNILLKFSSGEDSATILQNCNSIVRICDDQLISREAYRQLAAVYPALVREHVIERQRHEITASMNQEIPVKHFSIGYNIDDDCQANDNDNLSRPELNDSGNIDGAFRTIASLLHMLIPFLVSCDPPVLNKTDTLKLRFSGDGRQVGRSQNHVLMTMCILNEGEAVLTPVKQYTICLYIGKETYESLETAANLFTLELIGLNEDGFTDKQGNNWPVELFFSADWKFLALTMGVKSAIANNSCLYCECHKNQRYDMERTWINSRNKTGQVRANLFPMIPEENWIPDELHLLLRISDVLITEFFNDLNEDPKVFREIHYKKVLTEMKRIKVHFTFFESKTCRGKFNWTSLMGPAKLTILESFNVSQFIHGKRGQDIEKLWREFHFLYKFMRRRELSDDEISGFATQAKNWVRTFCKSSVGSVNAVVEEGLFPRTSVTPYMHVFSQHIPQFMKQLKQKGLSLRLFSTSSLEKKNHEQVHLFFAGTTMGGGTTGNPVVHDMLVYENRQIYYMIHDVPIGFKRKTIQI